MRKPKRLRFTPNHLTQHNLDALIEFNRRTQLMIVAVQAACRSAAETIQKFVPAIAAAFDTPEIREEIRLQNLYFQSWQRNELADTLTDAGISEAP